MENGQLNVEWHQLEAEFNSLMSVTPPKEEAKWKKKENYQKEAPKGENFGR